MHRQIYFYALRDDILSVLNFVEEKTTIKYVTAGISNTRKLEAYDHGVDIPSLGHATSERGVSSTSFLVTKANVPVEFREVSGTGVTYLFVDQLINPDTVVLTPSGLWGEDTILSGRVATASNTSIARGLMKHFSSGFKKHFFRVKAFLVGRQAMEFLNTGKRLTIALQSPREFDLRKDN